MNENLSMGQRAQGDEILNHTPDFYWKERDVFFEVKMSYFIRTDLFDLSEQWLKQYGNIGSRLYYTIYAKDNPDIEFYKLDDLQTLKNRYDIGKWASDGNPYYVIDKEITPHLKLKKMTELHI